MKTQTISKKAIGGALIVLIVSGNYAFAQTQSSMVANDEFSDNLTYALCVLLFVIGFAVLIVLKIRDDKKNPKQKIAQNNQPHILHRNHYGHRHQYHH
jgi:heme/copper-type cytochrome/quinol oxidase subunit 2